MTPEIEHPAALHQPRIGQLAGSGQFRLGFVLHFFLGREIGGRAGRGRIVVGRRCQTLGFVLKFALGFVRAFRERFAAELAQLLEAAADLAALLGMVAADGVEALDLERAQRIGRHVGSDPIALLAWGGGDQRRLHPLGPLALPERDRHPPHQPGLQLALRRQLGQEPAGQPRQLGRILALDRDMVQGREPVLERVARGARLALGRNGAARAGAVATGGLDLGGAAGAGFGHGLRPAAGDGSAATIAHRGTRS